MISPNSTSLTQSVAHPPTVETDMKYTRNITNANIGSASSLFVTTLSILSETLSFPDETLFTHFLVMFPVKLYLSEVIIGCVKQKCIEIFEIDDEANLSQVGNLKQEKFLNEDGVLKFPKLFQCKIVYKFSDELMMDLLITTRDGDRRKEVINFLGVLKLKIRNEMSPLPHEILHFDNNLHPLKISRILKNFDEGSPCGEPSLVLRGF